MHHLHHAGEQHGDTHQSYRGGGGDPKREEGGDAEDDQGGADADDPPRGTPKRLQTFEGAIAQDLQGVILFTHVHFPSPDLEAGCPLVTKGSTPGGLRRPTAGLLAGRPAPRTDAGDPDPRSQDHLPSA